MPKTAYARARTPLNRLLNDRRPAEERWSARQKPIWDELEAGTGDPEHRRRLTITASDGEGEFFTMHEHRLLLAVARICLANDRPDIWQQIYEAWDHAPVPGGEQVLLEELAAQAQRGEI